MLRNQETEKFEKGQSERCLCVYLYTRQPAARLPEFRYSVYQLQTTLITTPLRLVF
jgi:hypothetical protein